MMVGRFVEVCRRRGLKFNVGKGLECEVHVDRVRLEYVSEFKYLGFVLDEAGRDVVERWRVERGLQMLSGP